MKKLCAFVLFIIISMSCSSTKNIAFKTIPSRQIDFVILKSYAVNSTVSLPDTINHKFIVTADEFNKTFHMTKASPGTAIVPDFTSQSVVAIILHPTERVVSIDLQKAEIDDKDLNIYYTITDTTSWITYPHTIKAVAAVRKNNDIKQVNFYNNNAKEKTLSVND